MSHDRRRIRRATAPHEPIAASLSRPDGAFARTASGHWRLACLVGGLLVAVAAQADPPLQATYPDEPQDWLARRTDPEGLLPIDLEAHHPIDLIQITLGKWRPDAAAMDLFAGRYLPPGRFLRLDLVVAGLVNPPGPARPWDFAPFTYGPHPVFGFVEIDMDNDVETGGELDSPGFRYVSNAVRFGGKPALDDLEDRFALDRSALDNDFETAPYVERSGEEFHLALLGSVFIQPDVTVVAGDDDHVFEAGETWWIVAPWFHRAHGYEPFSLAEGGHVPGAYEPDCTLQFSHDPNADVTTISLVFPLTNEGAAEMWNEAPEPPNADPSDQFSVREALEDLHWSAVFLDVFPTGQPEEDIITEWQDKNANQFLQPGEWDITALLGTSYTAAHPTGEYYVWTDIWPNAVRGDVNGDGEAAETDRDALAAYIAARDEDDGTVDGRVELADYPVDFSVFDVDHSGAVAPLDVALVSLPRDLDGDDDVDLADMAVLQTCVSGSGTPYVGWPCGLADLDSDGDVDVADGERMVIGWDGPVECGGGPNW